MKDVPFRLCISVNITGSVRSVTTTFFHELQLKLFYCEEANSTKETTLVDRCSSDVLKMIFFNYYFTTQFLVRCLNS